ncbi:MAG: beta-lactamase family protein [Acidobacteria bacterium]|nr:beta-lactamase family protein [Acidobacteriota bacterium]
MPTLDDLRAAIEAEVASGLLPACQFAIGRDNEILAFEAFGTATTTDRLCIFSATKPMVSLTMALLLDEGLASLGDTIGEHIAELPRGLPDGIAEITIEQLMLHTGGFPNAAMPGADGGDPVLRLAALRTWRREWEPGTRFEYHYESAHWVLAELIERLTGRDFRAVVHERITAPLGLRRALGLAPDDTADICDLVSVTPETDEDPILRFNTAAVRASGNPAGGAFMTAAELAILYQALLHDRAPGTAGADPGSGAGSGPVWPAHVLADLTSTIRCTLPDAMMGVPVNRTLGLVLAGDDGLHEMRYAIFGRGCSPGSFGHAGMHGQVAWADPASGLSFVFLSNAVDADMMRSGMRSNALATIAAALEL